MKNLLLVTLATLGLTASTMAQNLPNYISANGLVGWWPFNGNANDESGNGNNGTINGATQTSNRFGNPNSAYDFDSSFIEVNGLNLSITQNYSISLWVNPTSYIEGYSVAIELNQNNFCNSNPLLGFWQSGNLIYHTCSNINNYVSMGSFSSIENQWTHYIIQLNNGSTIVYRNGVEITNGSISWPNIIANKLTIGNNGNLGQAPHNLPWYGKIDDIGVWNRALTQQEITDLYNANICYQTITVTDTLLINMGITGFNPVTYNNTIKIFPNPANNHITIDYGNFATMNGYQLKIENSLGQQLFQTNITQQTDYLSLNNWGGNGLYFVHIIDAQGNTIDIRKIVLQ